MEYVTVSAQEAWALLLDRDHAELDKLSNEVYEEWVVLRDSCLAKLRAVSRHPQAGSACEHDWKPMRNIEFGGSIESGEWCPRCGALRADSVEA